MSFEDWKKQNVALAEPRPTGFQAWQKENEAEGIVPIPAKSSKQTVDFAYDKYMDRLRIYAEGATAFTRESFESSGEAKKWIESGATQIPRSHFEKLQESHKRGRESFLTDQAYFEAVMLGKGEPDAIYSEWKQQQAEDQLDPIEGNWFTEMQYGSARIIPGMVEGGKQALPLMTAGVAIGGVAGGPLGAVAGLSTGFKVGSTYAWYRQGAGEMLLTMRDKGFDQGTSKIIAGIAALPYALIEQVQVGQLTPGLRQGANRVIQKSITRLMGRVAKKYGKTLTQEVLEEVAQEGVMIIAEDLASYFSDQGYPITEADLKQRAHRLWRTMVESGKAMALLPIPGAVVDMRVGDKGMKLAGKFADAGYNKDQSVTMARQVDAGRTIPAAHEFTVAETITNIHNKEGGSTIDQRTGRAIKEGFPVGIGESETLSKQKITTEDILKFRVEHAESLAQPNRQIGTWYDKENKNSVLDVVEVAPTEENAIELGRQYGERYVINLATGEEIAVTPAEAESTSFIKKTWPKFAGLVRDIALVPQSEIDIQIETGKIEKGSTSYYDGVKNIIYVSSEQSPLEQVETTVHELMHAWQLSRKGIEWYNVPVPKGITAEKYEKLPQEEKAFRAGDIARKKFEAKSAPGVEIAEKAKDQIKPETPDQAIGKQYGINPTETQQRLDNAEKKYRELKTKPVEDHTGAEKKELAFLRRNRKSIEALLDRDTQPMEPKRMTRRKALKLGHKIPDLLGWDEDKRRDFMEKITGLRSMKTMVPAQREQIITALQREAKVAGVETDVPGSTPAGELAAKLQERKQKPALTRRDRRNMKKLRKILYTMKSGTSFYFLHSSRLKRLSRSLDNYEDNGPFMRYVYQPVKDADTKANVNFSEAMAAAIVTLNDLNIDAPAMMVEIKDIGIEDKLSTAERIGVWALAQNPHTINHLRSEFSIKEIDKIVKSVEASENEMLVAAEIQNYFEQGWPQFEAIAKANGITQMTKAENYMTAFVTDKNDLGNANFLEGLMEQFTEGKFVPGQQHTIERKRGAQRNLELNIFVIHARAARAIERFKVMAPVASEVGSILKNRELRSALNDVTYGHGVRVFDRWLQDAVRGQAAYDSSAMSRSLRWLRMAGIHFVLGFKLLTATKQGISFFPAAGVHPGMLPLLLGNLEQASIGLDYKQMEKEAMSKSGLLRTRDWNRDLRQVYNQKAIRKMYKGQKLSPLSMRMASFIDRHTTTIVWTSAYQLSQQQEMSEEESVRFADGVVEDTQPMGKAVDLPSFFRGNELEKNLTVFQNQINQNFNMFWYDVLGEVKARKISLPMAGYRLLMQQIVPAMLLGMITRGRPPQSAEEIAKDLLFYMLCPFVFVGRWAYNVATGDWGPTRMIAEEPFVETGRLVGAIKRAIKDGATDEEIRSIMKYAARTAGAWSGGKIPLQAIQTAEGAWDLATGEDTDFRRLVWSKYALQKGQAEKKLRKKFAR